MGDAFGRGVSELKREIERRALIDGAFGPDAASVTRDDALDGGEANAGPGEVLLRVEALERAKQLGCELHIEPGAVIAHEVYGAAVAALRAPKLDPGAGPLARELPRVAEQVL